MRTWQEAQVLNNGKAWKGFAAVLVSGLIAGLAMVPVAGGQTQANQSKWKDQAEYDLYIQAGKNIQARTFAQAVTALDTWKQKYPDSAYKNDRSVFYIQAYAGEKQLAKAVDEAGTLLAAGDLNATFSDPATGPNQAITVLFTTVTAIVLVPNPTPEELDIGKKAAEVLLAFDRKPQGIADDQWNQARTQQLQPPAKGALLYIAMFPGNQAMAKKDWAAAEAAYGKALGDYPDAAAISYNLGLTFSYQKKNSEALYEFQRAAVLDPTLGGNNDAKKIQTFADNSYIKIHGSDEGLAQLKEQAKQAALPPAGFHVMTQTEVAEAKQKEFEQSNPQLAMWMKIKAALADTEGEQYFATQLKDAAVPKLKGTLVEAKPACHPKELLVAVPLPDAQGAPKAEISLKLDAPVAGKPELNSEIQWEGVPSAFTKDPFLLTMDTEKAKVEGLKAPPCTPAPVRAPAAKKKG
jgi:tetratricopeptide (TPR) repeat protein